MKKDRYLNRMLKNFTKIFILSLSLTLRPDCVLAASESKTSMVDAKLNALILQHEEMVTGNLAQEMLNRQGKNLADETLKYLNDPKNKSKLDTPQGRELRKHQALLLNYLTVKDHLEKCAKKSDSKRDLKNRILGSAFQSLSNTTNPNTPCYKPNANIKSYVDFNNEVMRVMKVQSTSDFLTELNKKVIANTMKSMVGLRYKFDPNFMKPGYLTQTDLNKLMAEICFKNSCAKLNPEFVREVSNVAIDYSKTLKNTEQRFSNKTATQSINQSIDRLNTALSKINVKNDKGIIYDSANLQDPNTKKEFDQYVYSYMNEVSGNAGPLLLTKTLREKAGEIKSFNEDDTKKDKKSSQFKFINHDHINESDVKTAIKEAEDKIFESARDSEKIINKEFNRKSSTRFGSNSSRKEDINELVKINPFAVGQLLIKNPEYAGLACDAINEIEVKDKKDATYDKYFMIGGAILGGALLLTGVGTMVGAYMITGSLTAGIAAGTVGGTIMSTTMIAGAVTETASAAYFGKKSYDSYVEMDKFEKAIFTNNGDNYSIIEKKEAYLNFKEARMKSMISLASAGFSGIRIERFFELSKFVTGPLKLGELKATTKIMEYLSESKVAGKLSEVVKLIGNKGSEVLDEFLVRLAKVGEKVRLQTLELLKDAKITPQKLKEVMEEALLAAKKCSKA